MISVVPFTSVFLPFISVFLPFQTWATQLLSSTTIDTMETHLCADPDVLNAAADMIREYTTLA